MDSCCFEPSKMIGLIGGWNTSKIGIYLWLMFATFLFNIGFAVRDINVYSYAHAHTHKTIMIWGHHLLFANMNLTKNRAMFGRMWFGYTKVANLFELIASLSSIRGDELITFTYHKWLVTIRDPPLFEWSIVGNHEKPCDLAKPTEGSQLPVRRPNQETTLW